MMKSLRRMLAKNAQRQKAWNRFRRPALFESLESRRVLDGAAPIAYGDAYVAREDAPLTVYASGVLANDRDAEGNVLKARVVSAPKLGRLALGADGSFVYTPNKDGNGQDTFTYCASDGSKLSNVATVTISVAAVNDPPVANGDAYSTREDVTLKVQSPGVLRNDTDVDSRTRTAILKTKPAHGVLTLNANGSFVYTPSADYSGADSFTYSAWDGMDESVPATVNITVTPVNDVPVAVGDAYVGMEGNLLRCSAPGVLGNDLDVDGDRLTAQIGARPSHGTVSLNTDGSFSYMPASGFRGTDMFTYRASDGMGRSAAATVTLTIVSGNQPPVAMNDSYSTSEDAVLTITAPGVLFNDTDVDSATLTALVASAPANGTLTLGADGSFVYVPSPNWSGIDGFTYQVSDGTAVSNTATVSISVVSVNDAPVAVGDAYETKAGVTLNVGASGVLGNDGDVDGDSLQSLLVSGPTHGVVSLNSDGSLAYVPAAGYSGADSFTYRASDGQCYSSAATVTITVTPLNSVNITAGWLAEQGAAPYILSQANTTYVLQTDVTVDGSGFVVGAAGVTLDLNGHTLTYGNAARPNVVNGGFEDGAGRNVPGWDVSNAPNASLAANTSYLWGNSVLAFPNITTPQTIVSNSIALAVGGHEYAATITPIGPYESSATLFVIDAATGAVLGSAESAAIDRGFAPVVTFTPSGPMTVQLKVVVTPAAGKTQTIYLDYASVDLSHDYGIVASPAPWYFASPLKDNSTIVSACRAATNFQVQNGNIVQGAARGYESHAINAKTILGVTVDNIHAVVSGIDTDAMYGQWAGNVIVTHSLFDNQVDKITNRMHKGNVLSFNAAEGSVIIEGNTINNAPRASIYVSQAKSVSIRHNEIHSDSIVTEGYGILVSGIQNFEISGNVITTQKSGRGILLDSLSSDRQPSLNGEVFENTVDIVERPNVEYGASLEATALRLRSYTERGHQNIRIHDNTFTARTAPGLVKAAVGARLTYLLDDTHLPLGVELVDNVFKAIADTADPSFWGRAFTLEGVVRDVGLEVRDNVFESNDISLGLGGNDGADAASATFVSNTFRKSAEGAPRDYKSTYAGYCNGTISDIRLLDSRFEGGATPRIVWTGSGLKDVYTGWLLDVRVATAGGTALAGATVEVLDRDGAVAATGSTDTAGLAGGLAVITTAYRQTGPDPNSVSADVRGPHKVRVCLAGFLPFEQLIDLKASTTISVVLTQ